jgi:ribosomal protein S18 acetylase RimI-like enzyme
VKTRDYDDVERFLEDTRPVLELNEAANSLVLGLCGQMVRHPNWLRSAPCLKTVVDGPNLVLTAVMTPPHKLIVMGHRRDLSRGADLLVRDLVREGRHGPGVFGPSEAPGIVGRAWAEATGRDCRLERQQRVYELREVLTPAPERGQLRLAGAQDLELVARWRYEFTVGIFGTANRRESDRLVRQRVKRRDVYLWDDGGPVSMAMKTRPTTHGITLSCVYTPLALRGRGHATSCVAELSRVLLAAGWNFCSLFADVGNPAAIHIYQKIGYRPVCEYSEYAFSRPT